jgi:hypothetical protein
VSNPASPKSQPGQAEASATPASGGKKKSDKPHAAPDPELKAMRRINAILADLDPDTATRVSQYVLERAIQRRQEANRLKYHEIGPTTPTMNRPHGGQIGAQ